MLMVLGAVAAQSLLGPAFRVTQDRGVVEGTSDPITVATVHPSSMLPAPDEDREAQRQAFDADLRTAARLL